ncbi:hypothetical protein V5O48_010464 [Marasmius crinis-equi]|uniref:HNH nuclease domain-containing protein n=1 Tax=Marasmius crinis-equi TaxID=585013 RepID=A0ABR3F8T1_9AGAR
MDALSAELHRNIALPGVREYYGKKGKKNGTAGLKVLLGWLDAFRLRIIASCVHGFRCILTWEPGGVNDDLNFCHLVARTTNSAHLRALEYSIGLYPETLFVDCYLNLIIMKVDLHHAFDKGKFLLVPPVHVLRRILAYLKRNAKVLLTKDRQKFYEMFSEHQWTYEFLSISFDPQRSINRKNIDQSRRVGGLDRFANREGYTEFRHPWDSPELKNVPSQAHPIFMAFNNVFLLWELTSEKFNELWNEHECVRVLHEIGELLTKKPPREFFQTKPGQVNEPPETENLAYLFPREAPYQKKAQLFHELLDEFQRARDGKLDGVLPGGVVSPSARKRLSASGSPLRVTRSAATGLRLENFIRESDGDVVVEEMEIVPKAVPPNTRKASYRGNSEAVRAGKDPTLRSKTDLGQLLSRNQGSDSNINGARVRSTSAKDSSKHNAPVEAVSFSAVRAPSKRKRSGSFEKVQDDFGRSIPSKIHCPRGAGTPISVSDNDEVVEPSEESTACLRRASVMSPRKPRGTSEHAARSPRCSLPYDDPSDDELSLPLRKRQSSTQKHDAKEWGNRQKRSRLKIAVLARSRNEQSSNSKQLEVLEVVDRGTSASSSPIHPWESSSRSRSPSRGSTINHTSSTNCPTTVELSSPPQRPRLQGPVASASPPRAPSRGGDDARSKDRRLSPNTHLGAGPFGSPYAKLSLIRRATSSATPLDHHTRSSTRNMSIIARKEDLTIHTSSSPEKVQATSEELIRSVEI